MFDEMGFGQAVAFVNTVGLLMDALFVSLPVSAAFAIRRGKRNRPHTTLLFPRLVFWGWFVLLGAAIAYFFSGAWYGENGPPPQEVAAQALMALMGFLVAVVAINIGLFKTTTPVGPGEAHVEPQHLGGTEKGLHR